MSLPHLDCLPNEKAADKLVLQTLEDYATSHPHIDILEAGCGRRWPYKLDGFDYRLTGIDIDAEALRIRKEDVGDLDEIVHSDLHKARFSEAQFDVIYSSYVLEHVYGVDALLGLFHKWLKPGGLLVIKVPDYQSVYGLITRITPHKFHIFYKRYFRGLRNAGKPGYGPYPTVHERAIARGPFHEFLSSNAMTMLQERGYGTLPGMQKHVSNTIGALTFGAYAGGHYNLLYISQKA